MGRQHVEATSWSAAPPSVVYGRLVDGASWPEWSGHDAAELVERGTGDGDGLGAVRVLHRGRTRSRERIVELVPDRRLGYALLSGLPLNDYRAKVDLTPERGGTTIRWSSDFTAKVPGTGPLYRWALTKFMGTAAASLASYAAELHARSATPAPGRPSD